MQVVIEPNLGPVMSAGECRRALDSIAVWSGTAVYLLSDRRNGEPVYCGTANGKTRLKGHLAKDDLANGPLGKTMRNPALRAYCLAQSPGWLGVQFVLTPDEDTARALERALILRYGLRSVGGKLFNQRLSG